jgi:ABC-2 type transport system permease protein
VLALHNLALAWTPDKVLVLAVALASGIAIFFSIFVLAAAFCFWTVEGKEATHVVSYGGVTLVDYPLDIYADWLRRFATFVLPLAFVSYYPALYLLDRPDPLSLPDWLRLLSPLAALALALLARLGWSVGVRHYQSTGS